MRLVFHWTVKVSFFGDVRFYMKGNVLKLLDTQ
jgi:hypothetical protein